MFTFFNSIISKFDSSKILVLILFQISTDIIIVNHVSAEIMELFDGKRFHLRISDVLPIYCFSCVTVQWLLLTLSPQKDLDPLFVLISAHV